MTKQWFKIFVCCWLLILHITTHAVEKLVIGYNADSAPYKFIDQGHANGLLIDYWKLWGKKNDILIIPAIIKTKDGQKFSLFTQEYLSYPYVIVSKKGFYSTSIILVNILNQALESITDTVFALSNQPIKKYATNIQITFIDDIQQGLKKIAVGDYFALIGDIASMTYTIQHKGFTNLKISGLIDHASQFSLKLNYENPLLLGILTKSIAMISNIEKNTIMQKWMPLKLVKGVNYTIIRNIIIIAAFLILLIILWLLQVKRQINQQKRHEIELLKSKQLAENANRYKSEFISNISHEIRTPINAIIGFNHLLLESDLNKKQLDYVKESTSSSKLLLGIINDVLDYSKIETGQLNLEQVEFSLNQLLIEIRQTLFEKSTNSTIDYCYLISPNVPNLYIGDSKRVLQILMNLINNAYKFTHEGFIMLHINKLSESENRIQLEFLIQDSGIGISQAQAKTLFQPFIKVDSSTTRKYGGTGLGLTISQQLAKEMHGQISLDSVEGEGSTFRTVIWLGKTKQNDQPKTLCNKNILLYHENNIILNALTHLLQQYNNQVTSAHDQTLTTLMTQQPYDLCLVSGKSIDIHTFIQIRATSINQQMPTIILGDFSQLVDKPQHIYSILQPFTLSELINIITEKKSDMKIKSANTSDKTKTLLIVDDNSLNQRVMTEILKKYGFKSDIAGDGQQAINAIEKNHYDLILMDLQMPIMDGYDATLIIRKHRSKQNLPIIALTADNQQETIQRCLDIGMNDYLPKPVLPDKLLHLINQWLAQSNHQTSNDQPILEPQRGLHATGGKMIFYIQLLTDFIQDHAQDYLLIQQTLAANDYPKAKRLAHTLAGLGGTLGAVRLHAEYQQLEQAIKQKHIEPALLASTQEVLHTTLSTIQDYLAKKSPLEVSGTMDEDENEEEIIKQIQHLDTLLAAGDGSSLAFIVDFEKTLKKHFDETITQTLIHHIENFEFDSARHTLNKILKNDKDSK